MYYIPILTYKSTTYNFVDSAFNVLIFRKRNAIFTKVLYPIPKKVKSLYGSPLIVAGAERTPSTFLFV